MTISPVVVRSERIACTENQSTESRYSLAGCFISTPPRHVNGLDRPSIPVKREELFSARSGVDAGKSYAVPACSCGARFGRFREREFLEREFLEREFLERE